MKPLYVIQARMGSTRLPGKVLADLGGMPLLGFMLQRLSPLGLNNIVVATTLESRDDPVAELVENVGAQVVRGPEHDVLKRYCMALDQAPTETLVRLTADCPLSDPHLVSAIVTYHNEVGSDYTSNTLIRDFPVGLDVEVIESRVLQIADEEAEDQSEREHVTPFIYRRPERFRLAAFRGNRSLSYKSWTVDTADDLERVRSIVARLKNHQASWEQIEDLTQTMGFADEKGLWLRSVLASEISPWPVNDPSKRVWAIMEEADQRGLVRLEVKAGKGSISFRFDQQDDSNQPVMEDVRDILKSNLQVQEIIG